ncbi:MAG: hypothetical protein J6Z43_09305, partial [Clostridiales bacterium]|nr:hypothetical protein [Clostridiales bacterium]
MSPYNIEVRQYDSSSLPPVDLKEVWRYSGCREVPSDEAMVSLMDEVIREFSGIARGKVCFVRAPHMPFETSSKGLAKVIAGSSEIIVFAATVVIEFDILIVRFKRTSPANELILQALGEERAE